MFIIDCVWFLDGGMFVVSSMDGFVSVVVFDEGEFGALEINIFEYVKFLLVLLRIGESVFDEVVVVVLVVFNLVVVGLGLMRIVLVRIASTFM